MNNFIAVFEAAFIGIKETQYSCITWEQENEDVDENFVKDLIKNTTARHFFKAHADKNANISLDNINVSIDKIEPFNY